MQNILLMTFGFSSHGWARPLWPLKAICLVNCNLFATQWSKQETLLVLHLGFTVAGSIFHTNFNIFAIIAQQFKNPYSLQ